MQTKANDDMAQVKELLEKSWSMDTDAPAGIYEFVQKKWAKRPGFFTPFHSVSDFNVTLNTPMVGSLIGAFVFGLAAITAATAALASAYSLVFAAGSALFGQFETAKTALALSAIAALIAGTAALAAVALAITVTIAIPLSIAEIVTRSLLTVGSSVVNLFSASSAEETEERHLASCSM